MAIPKTFRGANIIAFPQNPGLRQIQLDMVDTVAVQSSPFTLATDVLKWPGADLWTAELTLPQLNAVQAAEWSAFLAETEGMTGVFFLGHPLYRKPRGTHRGAPVCDGTNTPMTSTLYTRGWEPNAPGLLLPGDRLQIGYRMHLVRKTVASDSAGKAAISVWPSIREAPADGDQVILANPQGLWRLAANKRSLLTTETRLTGLTFNLLEAR